MSTIEKGAEAPVPGLDDSTLARLRGLLAHASIGMGIDRLDGENINANATLAASLGLSESDIRKKRFWEYTDPRDAERDRALFRELAAGRRPAYSMEKRYIRRDGTTVWGRLTRAVLRGPDGEPAYIAGITQDISERKAAEQALQESEARYRDFAECAADFFFEEDADGVMTYLSEGFARATGFSSGDLVGRATRLLLVDPAAPAAAEALQAVAERRRYRDVEIPIRLPNGMELWLRVSGNPHFDADGRFLGYRGAGTDITQRIQASAAYQETRGLYASLVETAPVGICIVQDDRLAFVNREGTRILAAAEAVDLAGRSIRDFAEDADWDLVRAVGARPSAEARERVETRLRRLDGNMISVRAWTCPVSFGGRSALQLVFEDVTEERRVQVALEESEARLHAIVEASPAGILLKDPGGRYRLANPALCSFWELPAEAIIGKCSREFQPAQIAEIGDASDERIRAGELRVPGGWDRQAEDGSRRYFSSVKFPIRGRNGEFLGIGGIITEVTERKRAEKSLRASEALLRTLVDHIPAAVTVKDLRGRYVLMNRLAQQWHGATDWETRPRTAYDYLPPEHAAAVEKIEHRIIEDRRPAQYERTNTLHDGSRIAILATKFPIMNAEGEVVRVGTIASDISALKKVEADLRLAKEAAEVASRAKTQFLANMSHELRTPMNSIIGFSEAMKEEIFGPLGHPKYREYVDDVLTSGRNLLNLISDILDISRVEAGGMTISEGWLEPGVIIAAAARTFAARAAELGLSLNVEVAPALPRLYADELRVKQILINLLSNAIKFTPSGGTVTIRSSVNPLGQIVLEVLDTGVGIPEDKLEVAMSVFGQVDDPLTRTREGAGLGLPLSKRLAELHGGRLTIESWVGIGTLARVVFPRERTRPRAMDGTADA